MYCLDCLSMFSMSTLFLLLENSENVLSRFSTICSMSKFFFFFNEISEKVLPISS